MKKIVSFTLALLLILSVYTCGAKAKLPDISEYGDMPITIAGLTDTEFTVTPNELATLELGSSSATGATEKAGTVNGIGPTLVTFLAQYGRSPDEFKYIRFIAADEYRVTLAGERYTETLVLMAISQKDKPLSKAEQPLRLIIPSKESSQWIYAVVRIEFVEAD